MLRTIHQPISVSRALRKGWKLLPLAGAVSKDCTIYRYCLVTPGLEPIAIVGPDTVNELMAKGLVPRQIMPGGQTVNIASLARSSDQECDDEDDDSVAVEIEGLLN